jgi:hypothetical protein
VAHCFIVDWGTQIFSAGVEGLAPRRRFVVKNKRKSFSNIHLGEETRYA